MKLFQTEIYKLTRRTSSKVLFILAPLFMLVTVGTVKLLGQLKFDKTMIGSLADSRVYTGALGGITSFITIAAIIIAAQLFTNDQQKGTIKLLLARPISRVQLLIAKFFAVLSFGLVLIIWTNVLSYIIYPLFLGGHNLTKASALYKTSLLEVTLRNSISEFFLIFYIAAIVMLFAVITNSQAFTIVIGILVTNLGTAINMIMVLFMSKFSGIQWNPLNMLSINEVSALEVSNLPASDMSGQLVATLTQGMNLPVMIGMILFYSAIFIAISTLIFKRKQI
ncbi:MAG: ABC transporter permease [Lactobacillales bacterium]|nr:ABC transporter permease [Lactobacillales bacterium]